MTYQPTNYEKALWTWLDLVVGSDVTEIRFANQRAPRAKSPFVTLQVISDIATQTPEARTTDKPFIPAGDDPPPDNGFIVELHEHRSATVSINVFGANHRALMKRIERSIFDPFVADFNTSNNIEVQEAIGSARDLTALVSTEYEGRTQLDFRVAYNATTESPFAMPAIKGAAAAGTLNDMNIHQTESEE